MKINNELNERVGGGAEEEEENGTYLNADFFLYLFILFFLL